MSNVILYDFVKIRRDLHVNTIVFRNVWILQPLCAYTHSMPFFLKLFYQNEAFYICLYGFDMFFFFYS